MKKCIVAATFIALCNGIYAQQSAFVSYADESSGLKVIASTDEETLIRFTLGTLWGKQLQHEWIFSLDEGTPIQDKGFPDLPKISASIVISDEHATSLEVIQTQFWEIPNINVAPSNGVLSRAINPSLVSREKGPVYALDAYYPISVASLASPYILRDHRAQVVSVFPVQYNPVTRSLRVYYSMDITVKKSNEKGVNPFIRTNNATTIDKEFYSIYKHLFLNYDFVQRYTPVEESGSMLIITHPDFEDEMKPFAEWKIQRGLPVDIVTTAVTGTTSVDIKQFVEFYYSMHQELKYILLVGDAEQIPPQLPDVTNPLAGPSDNFYGYLAGDDKYPEVFVGRFSAESINDVKTQVDRSLAYEKNPGTTDAFSKGTTIASAEGPGDDGQMDFEHARQLRSELLGFTYIAVDEFYDGTQGNVDEPDNPTPAMVVDALNDGRGVITYTGHGWSGGCGSSGFSTTDIPSLTNSGELPFFWSVACVNGEFMNTTCFAEHLLRATQPFTQQPIGAVATLMSTINQYWNEPMEAQDEMVSILTESHAANIKRSFGGISMNGCMKMNDTYGFSGMDMTDTWTCFGDPSLLVRTKVSEALQVNHITEAASGVSSLNVNCNTEEALISLSMNGVLLGIGTVSGGFANISYTPVMQQDTILVTATAFNRTPYQGIVVVSDLFSGNDQTPSHRYEMYPNPASEKVHIRHEYAIFEIHIMDISGKLLYRSTCLQHHTLDVSEWSNGLYLIKMMDQQGQVFNQKLIKN